MRIIAAVVATAALPNFVCAQTTPLRAKRNTAADKNAPAEIRAEQMTGSPDREVDLERDVEITRGQTKINADQAHYDMVEDEVKAKGSIRLQRPGEQYQGDELELNVDSGKGFLTQPRYRIELDPTHGTAQGKANRINFISQDEAIIQQGTYSTCEGPDPDWYLRANTLNLDTGKDIGLAYRSVVYFKDVPILAFPAMSFPISGARKSGFLPPTIGGTSKGGPEVTVPYYFNIAPNRDLTLYPKLITRRGLQVGANARYLGESYTGNTYLEGLPGDQITKTNRYAYSSTHAQGLGNGFSLGWNLNGASDDNYPNDFASSLTTSSQRLLLREVNLNWGMPNWSATARTTSFQVLQDPFAPIAKPYDRLPQFLVTGGRLDLEGFDWQVDGEATRFSLSERELNGRDRGNRYVVNPKLSYPILGSGFFVTPKVQLHSTYYQLENPSRRTTSSLSRTVPTFSLDSGLFFERDARFFGHDVTQTLEPRLLYVNTPYRDQRLFPNFDSADASFGFAQIFSENRFAGNDRIGDANQLTAALTSRFIEPSGEERLRLAIGQRYYFREQRVALDPNAQAATQNRSDLLLGALGKMTSTLSLDSLLQYNQGTHQVSNGNMSVQWQPAPKRVLNLEYRYLRNQINQYNVSGQWPLAMRWYGVGRVSYSIPEKKTIDFLAGLEYKADCWVFRLVGQRFATATTNKTTALFLQLELNGLSRIGSNPLESLRRNIPGYQLVNQPDPIVP